MTHLTEISSSQNGKIWCQNHHTLAQKPSNDSSNDPNLTAMPPKCHSVVNGANELNEPALNELSSSAPNARSFERTQLIEAVLLVVSAQQLNELTHLIWDWGIKAHLLVRDRMLKLDVAGVQGLVTIVI